MEAVSPHRKIQTKPEGQLLLVGSGLTGSPHDALGFLREKSGTIYPRRI